MGGLNHVEFWKHLWLINVFVETHGYWCLPFVKVSPLSSSDWFAFIWSFNQSFLNASSTFVYPINWSSLSILGVYLFNQLSLWQKMLFICFSSQQVGQHGGSGSGRPPCHVCDALYSLQSGGEMGHLYICLLLLHHTEYHRLWWLRSRYIIMAWNSL